MNNSTFALHKAYTVPMLAQQPPNLSSTRGKDLCEPFTSTKQLPASQAIPLQNIGPAIHQDDLESHGAAHGTQAHELTTVASIERSELKRHSLRWFLALSLMLGLAGGAGAIVGVLTHRANLGIATTVGVGGFVACVEAFWLSVLG